MEIRRQKFAAKEKQIRGSMIENNGDHRQSKFDRVKISSALLHRILKLSTKEYEVFVELGQGRELDEIAPRLKKQLNSVYVMVQRMRPKLGIKTLAMLRFEATRYLLSGIERQDLHFVHFVFPQEQKLSSAA